MMNVEIGDRLTCYRPGETDLIAGRTYTVAEVFTVNDSCALRELPGRVFWLRRFTSERVDDDPRWGARADVG